MINIKLFIVGLAFLLGLPHLVFSQTAQPDRFLLLEKPEIDLPNEAFYRDQINKLSFQLISRHGGYHFFLSNSPELENNNQLNYLKIKTGRVPGKKDSYYVHMQQVSGKTQNAIREFMATEIPERFLMIEMRLGVLQALYGTAIARQELRRILERNPDYKNFLKENDKLEEGASGKDEAQSNEDVQNKDLPNESSASNRRNRGGAPESSANMSGYQTTLLDNLIVSQLLEQKNTPKVNSRNTDPNLAAQILDIENEKKRIRRSLQKEKEKEKASNEDRNESQASGQQQLSTSINEEEKRWPGKATRPRESRTLFDLVYLNRNLETKYLIDVDNNFNYYGPRLTHRRNLSETRGDDLVFSMMTLRPLPINEVDYSVPSVNNVHFQYLSDLYFLPFDLLAGIHYDSQFFVNLPVFNKGLKVASVKLIWAQVGVERSFNFGSTIVSFQALMAKNVFSSTDFRDDFDAKLEASRVNFGVDVIYNKLRLGAHFSTESITSQNLANFDVKQTSFYLNAAYKIF